MKFSEAKAIFCGFFLISGIVLTILLPKFVLAEGCHNDFDRIYNEEYQKNGIEDTNTIDNLAMKAPQTNNSLETDTCEIDSQNTDDGVGFFAGGKITGEPGIMESTSVVSFPLDGNAWRSFDGKINNWGFCHQMTGNWHDIDEFCECMGYEGAVAEGDEPCYISSDQSQYRWTVDWDKSGCVEEGEDMGRGDALTRVKCTDENIIVHELKTEIEGGGIVHIDGRPFSPIVYEDGSTATLEAVAHEDWEFVEWTGDIAEEELEAFATTEEKTWEVPDGVEEVDVLVVGGGGGGGFQKDFNTAGAGGGGAGGVVLAEGYDVDPGEQIDIKVGEGGEGEKQNTDYGEDGESSSFGSLVALGGGGGGAGQTEDDGWGGYWQAVKGNDGGSGGGSRTEEEVVPGGEGLQPGTNDGFDDYGNDGGDGKGAGGDEEPYDQGAGGGGGAGEAGYPNPDPEGATGGDGGEGMCFEDIFGDEYGDDGCFAGGGGGGAGESDENYGKGGLGGGGDGANHVDTPAQDGEPNTGGGGGGGSSDPAATGGDGGSGIVLVRYEKDVNSTKEKITLTMDQDREITAHFEEEFGKIYDWCDLDELRDNLYADAVLMNDLDETTDGYGEEDCGWDEDKGWEPIDDFEGTFDGDGYEIKDLVIDRPNEEFVGLFGNTEEGSVIENIGVVDADIIGERLMGILSGTPRGIVRHSYTSGMIESSRDYGESNAGGLAGQPYGEIKDTYSSADVIGHNRVGGLVGQNYAQIDNSYSVGEVTGNDDVGGLVGWDIGGYGEITDSYWDNITSGQETSNGGKGKYTYEMTLEDTFQDWDFTGTWQSNEWETYPCLYWQDECPVAPEQNLAVEAEGEGKVEVEWYEGEDKDEMVDEEEDFGILGGIEVSLEAVPEEGYEFVEWFETLWFECLEHQDEDKCGDQVTIPGNMGTHTEYTLAFWFVQDEKPDVWHYLMDTREEGAESPWEDFWGPAYDGSDISNLAGADIPDTKYETGTWNHLIVTSDGSNTHAYLNGELEDTVGNAEEMDLENEFRIGNRFSQDETWIGKIGDVRIYDRALDEDEINDLYENKYMELGDEMAWWRMNEGEGNTINDFSGNGNHGSIDGAEWIVGSPEEEEITLAMDGNKEVTALFEETVKHELTVETDPKEGGNVTVGWEDVDGEDVEEEVVENETFEIVESTEVELTAESSDGWEFVEWTGDKEEDFHETITIEMDEDKEVTTHFEPEEYELKVEAMPEHGGNITVEWDEEEYVVYDEKSFNIEYGTWVELEAVEEEEWEFVNWTGDKETEDEHIEVFINGNKNLTANFNPRLTLDVNNEQGGNVTVDGMPLGPLGYPYSDYYSYGSEMELEATSADGWNFSFWSGDTEGIEDRESNNTNITMDDSYHVTAYFEADHVINVTVLGKGYVDVDGEKVLDKKTFYYGYGDIAELEAFPEHGFSLREWRGTEESGREIEITVDEDMEIYAIFTMADHCRLTICAPGGICDEVTVRC